MVLNVFIGVVALAARVLIEMQSGIGWGISGRSQGKSASRGDDWAVTPAPHSPALQNGTKLQTCHTCPPFHTLFFLSDIFLFPPADFCSSFKASIRA